MRHMLQRGFSMRSQPRPSAFRIVERPFYTNAYRLSFELRDTEGQAISGFHLLVWNLDRCNRALSNAGNVHDISTIYSSLHIDICCINVHERMNVIGFEPLDCS